MKLVYNNYEFSEHSHIDIETELIYDDAGRVVIEKRLTIRVQSVVTPTVLGNSGDCLNNDMTINEIRELLAEPAKRLELTGVGFGPLNVNATGGDDAQLDINNGPKPQTLKWTPIASEAAAEIVWVCVVALPPCERDFGLKALTFSIGFQINEKGFTSRTVRGYLEVSQSLVAGGQTADDFRDRIEVERSTNCKRSQNYQLSPDRSRLDFTVTDTEIESPNAYPAGVVSISAPYRLRVEKPRSFEVPGVHSLNVRVTLTATERRSRAWEVFLAIFARRIERHIAVDIPVIVQSIDISEDFFSNEYRFSVNWKVTTSFETLLLNSGLFDPYPVDWQAWSTSVAELQRNRGLGQYRFSGGVQPDPLISLCDADTARTAFVVNEATQYFRSLTPFTILCNETPPPPALSWLKYKAELIEHVDLNRTYHTTYGASSVSVEDFDPSSPEGGTMTEVENDEDVEHYISQGVASQFWIWRGTARRIGYPISRIGKMKIGETYVEIIGQPVISNRLVGYQMCQPVYEAKWNIAFIAVETPTPTDEDNDPTSVNNDYPEDVATGP